MPTERRLFAKLRVVAWGLHVGRESSERLQEKEPRSQVEKPHPLRRTRSERRVSGNPISWHAEQLVSKVLKDLTILYRCHDDKTNTFYRTLHRRRSSGPVKFIQNRILGRRRTKYYRTDFTRHNRFQLFWPILHVSTLSSCYQSLSIRITFWLGDGDRWTVSDRDSRRLITNLINYLIRTWLRYNQKL